MSTDLYLNLYVYTYISLSFRLVANTGDIATTEHHQYTNDSDSDVKSITIVQPKHINENFGWGFTVSWMECWMDGWMDKWELTDEQMKRQIDILR